MALHKDFPKDKFAILEPEIRWFPADEALREQGYEKLLPPFVPEGLLNGAMTRTPGRKRLLIKCSM